jgi:WD40 repeat protein
MLSLRRLFGEDIFISYSRKDGGHYAAGLADKLTERGLSCFLDRLEAQPDHNLPGRLRRRLRNATILVIVGSEAAAQSTFVAQEIAEFKKTGRTIVPISVDGAVEGAIWYESIPGLPPEPETREALTSGNPSPNVISRIEKSFRYTRRNQRMFRMVAGALAVFLGLLVASGYYFQVAAARLTEARRAEEQAAAARREADAQGANAIKMADLAERRRQDAERAEQAAAEADARTEAAASRAVAEEARAREATARAEAASREAEQRQAEADSIQFANRAVRSMEEDPVRSLKLSMAAAERARTDEARDALRESAERSRLRVVNWADGDWREGGWLRAAYSRDGRKVVAATDKGQAKVFDAATGKTLATLSVRDDNFMVANFSADGRRIVTGSPDGVVCVWDAATGIKLKVMRTQGQAAARPGAGQSDGAVDEREEDRVQRVVVFAAFVGDGPRVVTASWGGVVRIWDADTGRLLHKLDGQANSRNLLSDLPVPNLETSFSEDRKRVITLRAAEDKGIFATVWDTETGAEIKSFSKPLSLYMFASLSGDGLSAVTVGADSIKPEEVKEDQEAQQLGKTKKDPTFVVKVWDVTSGNERKVLSDYYGLEGKLFYPVVSHDGRHIVTCNEQGTIQSWVLDDRPAEPLNTWVGHKRSPLRSPTGNPHGLVDEDRGIPWYAAFSRDGERVVSIAGDSFVRVTDFDLGRQLFASSIPHFDDKNLKTPFVHASFNRDGRSLLASGADGGARIYDLAPRRLPDDLDALLRVAPSMLPITLTPKESRLLLEGKPWGPPSFVNQPQREDAEPTLEREPQAGTAPEPAAAAECCRAAGAAPPAILATLRSLLDAELGIDASVYRCDGRLVEDYGADGEDFVRFAESLDVSFALTTADYDYRDITTPCNIIQMLMRRASKHVKE